MCLQCSANVQDYSLYFIHLLYQCCAYGVRRCVTMNFEWDVEIWVCHDRCSCQLTFQNPDGFSHFCRDTRPWFSRIDEHCQRFCFFRVVVDKFPVKRTHSLKGGYLCSALRLELVDHLRFQGIWLEALYSDHMTKVSNLSACQDTFLSLEMHPSLPQCGKDFS